LSIALHRLEKDKHVVVNYGQGNCFVGPENVADTLDNYGQVLSDFRNFAQLLFKRKIHRSSPQ